jgi:two-component system CheB/CheR fusion protein
LTVPVTFLDITDAKRNERLEAARVLAEEIVDAVREPFLVLDAKLRVVRANRAYYQTFEIEAPQTGGQISGELESHQWTTRELRDRLERALREGGIDDFEVEAEFPARTSKAAPVRRPCRPRRMRSPI